MGRSPFSMLGFSISKSFEDSDIPRTICCYQGSPFRRSILKSCPKLGKLSYNKIDMNYGQINDLKEIRISEAYTSRS